LGQKYHVEGGKDGKIVKSLLQTYSLDELKKYCDMFFRFPDDFTMEVGYSIGTFKAYIKKAVLISSGKTANLSKKGMKTYMAGLQWLKKGEKGDAE